MAELGGKVIEGAQNIFFAQLADPSTTKFAVSATRFMSGKFPLMIFGLPGAALAMYKAAKPENKKVVGGLLLSAALTSMLTGITEPLEFTFLFVAPALYGVHCVLAGAAYMLMHIFKVGVGMTFSGGLIDMFLFGILQGNAKTNWIWIVIVGVVYFVVYYFLFGFMIRKMDLKTPGRNDDEEVKLYRRSDVEARKNGGAGASENGEKDDTISRMICKGLGGKKNISDVDCCITRLRCTVYDPSLVNEETLKASGASGVVRKGEGVQVIYGPKVTLIKSDLEDYLERCGDNDDEDDVATHEVTPEETKAVEEKTNEKKLVKSITIGSPIKGVAAEVPDEAFAERMMGDGAAVLPTDPVVCAPEDGEVLFIFDTKHAVGYAMDNGISVLIHVGIDTVKLEGKGFEILTEQGAKLKKGDPIMRLDLDYLKEHAPSVMSPILCTELTDNQKISLLKEGEIEKGEPLFAVNIYE